MLTQTHEPYMNVAGMDMHRRASSSLRLWRYDCDDVLDGRVYIIRGLKVVAEQHWDAYTEAYASKPDGQHALECCYMTAVEDVTTNDVVSRCFW